MAGSGGGKNQVNLEKYKTKFNLIHDFKLLKNKKGKFIPVTGRGGHKSDTLSLSHNL
jgi:hypothetical protein